MKQFLLYSLISLSVFFSVNLELEAQKSKVAYMQERV